MLSLRLRTGVLAPQKHDAGPGRTGRSVMYKLSHVIAVLGRSFWLCSFTLILRLVRKFCMLLHWHTTSP